MKRAKVVIEFITLVIAGFVAYFTYNIMLDTGEQAKQNRRAVDQTEYALRYQREKDSLDRFGQDKRDALSNQSLRLRDSIGIVSFQTEMRAYISVKLGRDVRPMGSSIEVPWIILNTGKTPAINARLNKGISAEQFPEQDLKRFKLGPVVLKFYPGIPDSNIATHPIPLSNPSEFWSGHRRLYFAIIVEYQDIFHHIHHTYGHQWASMSGYTGGMPTPEDD